MRPHGQPRLGAWPQRAAILAALAAASAIVACSDDRGDPAAAVDAAPSPQPADARSSADRPPRETPGSSDGGDFGCPEVPIAYVYEAADPFTKVQGAAPLLAQAGFDVRPLPLGTKPSTLQGLIVFGAFASEQAEYRAYVKQNATELFTFVDKANVLLQLAQADQTEALPPFLPSGYIARRHDLDLERLYVVNGDNPLLAGVAVDGNFLAWRGGLLGWETFLDQSGFEVMLADDETGRNAALMEAAYGQGRFVLAAMALDKSLGSGPADAPFRQPIGEPAARDAFNRAFFANLFGHVKNVCRRRAPELRITTSSTEGVYAKDSFVLAILPDTQMYAQSWPGIFTAQTSWIAANARRLSIPYVLHLGDIVNLNTPEEWRRALGAMSLLDGVVPYALATGNHDYGPAGSAATRETYMNEYFKFEAQAAWPTFGGAYETGKLDNTYHLFSAGGRDYIVISLEWSPRDEVVVWADDVMARHPERVGILITHAYLNWNDRRYDINEKDNPQNPQDFNPKFYGTPGGGNDGEELWQKLVRRHRFAFVFNGHVLNDGAGYLASVTDKGNTCHQMLSNYQFRDLGGEGYMRTLEFLRDGKTVKVRSYSPLYDNFLTDPQQNFTVTLDLAPPAASP